MNETVISWTPQNWITVLLMVFLGSVIVGALAATVHRVRSRASD
jgi:hypothetical protein